MSHRLVIRAEAESEISEAAEWYEERSAGLAGEFLRSIDATIASIRRRPHQYPIVLPGMGRALLRRFPYSIIFKTEGETVVVLACFHWRQDPEGWSQRS